MWDLPTTPADHFKRFHIALGASAVNFARNRRTLKYQESSSSSTSGGFRADYPVHDIFRKQCFDLVRHSNLRDEAIDALLTFEFVKSPAVAHTRIACQQWGSLQRLEILRYALEDDEMQLHYDHFSMHIRCALLLLRIRSAFLAVRLNRPQALATVTDLKQDFSDLQSYQD